MKIKAVAIKSFATFILGGGVFSQIHKAVEAWEDKELSGPLKRQAVQHYLMDALQEIGSWAINLGIELAVAYMKEKQNG
jgi:hypothetical protein